MAAHRAPAQLAPSRSCRRVSSAMKRSVEALDASSPRRPQGGRAKRRPGEGAGLVSIKYALAFGGEAGSFYAGDGDGLVIVRRVARNPPPRRGSIHERIRRAISHADAGPSRHDRVPAAFINSPRSLGPRKCSRSGTVLHSARLLPAADGDERHRPSAADAHSRTAWSRTRRSCRMGDASTMGQPAIMSIATAQAVSARSSAPLARATKAMIALAEAGERSVMRAPRLAAIGSTMCAIRSCR